MPGADLAAVLLLLENMTLSPTEASRVRSAIHIHASSAIAKQPAVSATLRLVDTPPKAALQSESDVSTSSIGTEATLTSDDFTVVTKTPLGIESPLPTSLSLSTSDASDSESSGPGPAITDALQDTPVTSTVTGIIGDEARFQQTHNGFNFDVPKAGDAGPFYLVTRGHRVGVFCMWQRTSPHVLGYSCSSFSRVPSLQNGLDGMITAIELGEAQWLP